MFISTRAALQALRDANPCARITEDLLRGALRRSPDLAPRLFAGRFAWREEEVAALAKFLGLQAPSQVPQTAGGEG